MDVVISIASYARGCVLVFSSIVGNKERGWVEVVRNVRGGLTTAHGIGGRRIGAPTPNFSEADQSFKPPIFTFTRAVICS